MMFSVVIPLHNKQELVGRCIASVLGQTRQDFEIIVVDDGSTDDSVERLRSFDDPRLRVVRQDNAGPGPARSRGISESKGTWIAFLDADDYWFSDHLGELALLAASYPDAGLIATSRLTGEDPAASQPRQGPARRRLIDYFRAAAKDLAVVWTSAAAVRRSISLAVGSFEPVRAGEDLDYWARVALVAPVAKSSRITTYYFRHDQSIMVEIDRERAEAPVPASLLELWPSVALIERVKHAPEHAGRKAAFELYQRNAVYRAIIGHLARGEIDHARRVAGLRPGRHFDRAAAAALALRLPGALIAALLATRATLRRK